MSGEYKAFNWLNLRPGLRFNKNSLYDAPPVVPSINAKLSLGKQTDLRLSYARGFRAPALRELYFDFHDANHDINGNENLKAEYSNSFNASISWEKALKNGSGIKSVVSGFYNHFDNQITTALANDPSSPNLSVYVNLEKFKTTGGSWENNFVSKNLSASIAFFYIGRFNRYSEEPAYVTKGLPDFVWSPEISSTVMYSILRSGTSIGLFYKFTGKTPVYQVATIGGQQSLVLAETESFHFADFTINQKAGARLIFSGGLKNIFDVTRITNTTTDQGGVHGAGGPILKAAGRSWFLGVSFQFAK